MRLIDAEKIDFSEVLGGQSDFAKDVREEAKALIDKAFKSLYPGKEYRACIEPDITDDQGEKAYGITIFYEDETPIVAISAELAIKDAAEVFAHELAHVAAGEGAGHGKEWEEAFENISKEYQRIGEEMFGRR